MHINVSHILASELGEQASFDITGENPEIPDLELTQPITGIATAVRLEGGLQLEGQVHLVFGLECQRCLDPYQHKADLEIGGFFSIKPAEDEWPISARGEINLTPLVREEALINIPIQQLCAKDCQGLCGECGNKLEDGHKHQLQENIHKPRIKKG